MPSTPTHRRATGRRFLVAAAVLAATAAAYRTFGAAQEVTAQPARECGGLPAFAFIEEDGWRYEFHAVTGRERLVRLEDGAGAENLAAERPEVVARLRTSIARNLRIGDLDELRDVHRDAIDRLRALGYL